MVLVFSDTDLYLISKFTGKEMEDTSQYFIFLCPRVVLCGVGLKFAKGIRRRHKQKERNCGLLLVPVLLIFLNFNTRNLKRSFSVNIRLHRAPLSRYNRYAQMGVD